jgi:hypothetical protein
MFYDWILFEVGIMINPQNALNLLLSREQNHSSPIVKSYYKYDKSRMIAHLGKI